MHEVPSTSSPSGTVTPRRTLFTTQRGGAGYPRVMRGLRIGAIAGLAAIGAAASTGVGAQGTPGLSPRAAPAALTYGDTTTISGQVPAATTSETVTLQRRLAGQPGYRVVATRPAGPDRRFSFVDRPRANALYRVTASTPSTPVAVSVRSAVGLRIDTSVPRRGGTVRFFGTVRPDISGSSAQVERKSVTGAYIAIAQLQLVTDALHHARYARRIHISRSGRYRVRVAGSRTLAPGISRTVVLHVRRR